MEIGQRVSLHSHDGFRRFVTINRIAVFQGSEFALRFCYETNEGSEFHMTPDPETGRRFNVSGKDFWISEPI